MRKGSKFYAICLLIACLAAWMFGYALGGQLEPNKPLEGARELENVTDWQTVKEYGIEAQGTFINDRGSRE